VWAKAYGYDLGYFGEAVGLRRNGSVVVAGSGGETGWVGFGPSSGIDVLLIEYGASGELQSIGGFGGLSVDVAYGMAVSHDDWVYLTGQFGGGPDLPERMGYAWFLSAFSPDGEQVWLHVDAAQ
jgi:hypothetical protein